MACSSLSVAPLVRVNNSKKVAGGKMRTNSHSQRMLHVMGGEGVGRKYMEVS